MRNRLRALVGVTALLLVPGLSRSAHAAEPEGDREALQASALQGRAPEGPLAAPSATEVGDWIEPMFELEQPAMLAYLPGPAALIAPPSFYAKRSRDRKFETEFGERDPRTRQRPRTHRFRLALASHWVRLTQTQNTQTQEFTRFHYAPILLDLGYQAQFLKYVMVRLAVAVGANVANSRHAMRASVYPQLFVGYQGKILGVALGYGFDWTIPPTFGATDPSVSDSLEEPVITRNHVVQGELSMTSKIDRVAMTFALSLGGMQSDLSHYDTVNRKWRFVLGLQAGVFFDGTGRREKKARKKAEAEGR